MKVCHLSTVHPMFDSRIFYKECKSLAEVGYNVYLIITNNKDEIIDNINIHALPNPKNRVQRMLFLPFLALIKALRIKASIYHFHDPELIPIGVILRLLRKKVIYDVHEDVSKDIIDKEWLGCAIIRKIIAYLMLIIEKAGAFLFNAIIVATPDISDKFTKSKTILIRNLPIINFIDNVNLNFSKKKNKSVLIYAGVLSRERGINNLIQAMQKIKNMAELWLIGRWDDEMYEKECKNLIAWKYCNYIGYLKPEEVYSYMKNSDVGLINFFPIENHINALPNKPFEYMACSLPIIMSDFTYWHSLFNTCALFIDPYNIDDIAEKIDILLNDTNLRKKLGKNGRILVEKSYTWEMESKKLVSLYKKIL